MRTFSAESIERIDYWHKIFDIRINEYTLHHDEVKVEHIDEAVQYILSPQWKSLPDSPGDWLWICAFSCGCCVMEAGIVWVLSEDDCSEENRLKMDEINGFKVQWQTNKHKKPEHINGYLKINLPNINTMFELEKCKT